ncbi:hypothetical protein WMF45_13615 [Sorangium sp. So ce448]|uniref:hypothetical protein n=1 Tax=Sorangium sp. So ce448 TaxID=3133314 RepID=UPI003F6478AD
MLSQRRYGAALGRLDEADGATRADVRLDLCDGVALARGGRRWPPELMLEDLVAG